MSRKYGYKWNWPRQNVSHDEAMCIVYDLQIMFLEEEIRKITRRLNARKKKVTKK